MVDPQPRDQRERQFSYEKRPHRPRTEHFPSQLLSFPGNHRVVCHRLYLHTDILAEVEAGIGPIFGILLPPGYLASWSMKSPKQSDPRDSSGKPSKKKSPSHGVDPWYLRHQRLTLASVAIFGCAVIFLLTEIGARLFVPSWAPRTKERALFWTYDESLGWAHVPNQRGQFTQLSFSVEVANNSRGLRDDEYPLERTDRKRMLVLGDSFAWGFGVEHQERFSEVLERSQPDWEIINSGVSSYGTDQELLYYQESGKDYDPDVVLVLFVPNDFTNNVSIHHSTYNKPRFVLQGDGLILENVPVPRANLAWRVSRYLAGKSYLGSRLHIASSFYRFSTAKTGASEHELVVGGQGHAVQFEVTRRLIAALDDLCQEQGSQLVLVSIPMAIDQVSLLRDEATARDIPYLSLNEFFLQIDEKVTLRYNGHWGARGHELAAEAIEAFLVEIDLF